MSSQSYDIAIIGGSLSARIAAALLAKRGNKVLFLRNSEARAPAWFHSSIFLEKLLGVLGGRSCFVAQLPFQVISERSRLTLGNDIPLAEELQREFGAAAVQVNQWLSELNRQGTQLEELFWENGGLPWPSLKAAARFKFLCVRRHIDLSELDKPVAPSLEKIPLTARTFVKDMLQGLSLTSVSELSYARAAMLWAQALRPENLKEPDFSQMLNKRFEQFHGIKAPLDDLKMIDSNGSRWLGGHFKSGHTFTAQHFLLGDKALGYLFNLAEASPTAYPQTAWGRQTSDLSHQLSPLLATRIICGGPLPLRLALEHDLEIQGLIMTRPEATEAEIRKQLEPVLPFAKYQLTAESPPPVPANGYGQVSPLAKLPIHISANLYCADRTVLLPDMGAAGAAMLAWTLVEKLGRKLSEKKG